VVVELEGSLPKRNRGAGGRPVIGSLPSGLPAYTRLTAI